MPSERNKEEETRGMSGPVGTRRRY